MVQLSRADTQALVLHVDSLIEQIAGRDTAPGILGLARSVSPSF